MSGKYNFNPETFGKQPTSSSSASSSSSSEPSEPQFSICDIIIPEQTLEQFLDNPGYGADNDMLLEFIGSFQEVYEKKEELVKYVLYNLKLFR